MTSLKRIGLLWKDLSRRIANNKALDDLMHYWVQIQTLSLCRRLTDCYTIEEIAIPSRNGRSQNSKHIKLYVETNMLENIRIESVTNVLEKYSRTIPLDNRPQHNYNI